MMEAVLQDISFADESFALDDMDVSLNISLAEDGQAEINNNVNEKVISTLKVGEHDEETEEGGGQTASESSRTVNISVNPPAKPREVFRCKDCNYKTTSRGTLTKHHQGIHLLRKYTCDTCQKSYQEKYDLKEHIRTIHQNIPFICEICSLAFNGRKVLNMHKKNTHSGQFKFKCNYCGKQLNNKDQYYGHINGHIGSKPYTCINCSKYFAYKQNLNRHMIKCVHKPDSYKCDECNKTMSSLSALSDHKEGKHGGKNRICNTCGKAFAWRTSLVRHQMKCAKNK